MLIACIAGLNQGGPPFSPARLGLTWRIQYGLGIVPILFMLYHRLVRLKESAVWQVSWGLLCLALCQPKIAWCAWSRAQSWESMQALAACMCLSIIPSFECACS